MDKVIPHPKFSSILVVMGVAGVGKTTIGQWLAKELGYAFCDADVYHSAEDIAKLKQGIPLTDEDRKKWLKKIVNLIHEDLLSKKPLVLACSALKKSYRHLLRRNNPEIKFIYLKAPFHPIHQRLLARTEHFMNPNLLESQYAILQEPDDALVVDATLAPEEIVAFILRHLNSI